VIETMTQNGVKPRNDGDARRALYALLAGAQDDELADFRHVQEEIVEEAERLLEGRVAE